MTCTPEDQFQNLLRELTAPDSQAASGEDGRASFVFPDGLCAVIRLEAATRSVLVEIFILDLSFRTGLAREVLLEGILEVNTIGMYGRPFFAGLDDRDFVLIFNRLPLAGLSTAKILEEMEYLLKQSRSLSDILGRLSLGLMPAGGRASPIETTGIPGPV